MTLSPAPGRPPGERQAGLTRVPKGMAELRRRRAMSYWRRLEKDSILILDLEGLVYKGSAGISCSHIISSYHEIILFFC